MPPITCNRAGRLLQLALPGAGLNCGDKGLPASFAKLTELQILDVAYNEIGGTTAAMGTIIGQVRGGQHGLVLPDAYNSV
jgi:hypothetical protein